MKFWWSLASEVEERNTPRLCRSRKRFLAPGPAVTALIAGRDKQANHPTSSGKSTVTSKTRWNRFENMWNLDDSGFQDAVCPVFCCPHGWAIGPKRSRDGMASDDDKVTFQLISSIYRNKHELTNGIRSEITVWHSMTMYDPHSQLVFNRFKVYNHVAASHIFAVQYCRPILKRNLQGVHEGARM